MSKFLRVVMELLPFAIEVVEHLMDDDDSQHNRRAVAVESIMKKHNCSESQARCAVEFGVDEAKNHRE